MIVGIQRNLILIKNYRKVLSHLTIFIFTDEDHITVIYFCFIDDVLSRYVQIVVSFKIVEWLNGLLYIFNGIENKNPIFNGVEDKTPFFLAVFEINVL